MPRSRHAQGRPGTEVIPVDWEATHRPVMEKTLTGGECTLRPPGTVQTWDPVEEQNVATPKPVYYDGGCRVQALAGKVNPVTAADDPETVADYLVVVPADTAPAEGDLVTVTASGDAQLDDRVLRIVQVVRGTQRFERDLFCTFTG